MRFLHSGSPFRIFGLSAAVTIVAALLVGIIDSVQAMTVVLFLGVAEVALSFDNAIINAKTLGGMNEFWQKIFLTVGVLIASARESAFAHWQAGSAERHPGARDASRLVPNTRRR
jgi:hypothetical protein